MEQVYLRCILTAKLQSYIIKAKAALAPLDQQGGFRKSLVLYNCLNRAGICTRTAGDAGICINYVSAVAFLDRINWACICTRTTRETCICNFICHDCFTSGNQIFTGLPCTVFIITDSPLKCKWFSMESKNFFTANCTNTVLGNPDYSAICSSACRKMVSIWSSANA